MARGSNSLSFISPNLKTKTIEGLLKTNVFDKLSDAGKGAPEVIILDPAGKENTIPIKIKKEPNGVYVCDYTPIVQGVHSVNVFFANQPVPRSPFAVGIANGNQKW